MHNITYEYDVLNRLITVEQDGDTIAAYEYDANGNRTRLTYPVTGTATTYTYNLANWVTGMTSKTGKKTLTSYAYTYYASGNRQSETDKSRAVTTYVYDDLGRLTKESETGGLTVKYTYNSAGNRTKMAVTGTETYTTTYTYDKNNRLTQEKKTAGSTAATTVYEYDANGNLIQKSTPNGAELYDYNGFNQLTVLKQGGTATTYAYNASGIRTAKRTVNGGTYFLLDGGNVVAEYTDGAQTAFSVWGINLISRKSGGTTKFYVQDAHGDVVCVTENTGVPIRYYAYDAFGNEKNPDSTDSNPFRYCGEYFDKETKTYYLRARYYDPAIGRFTQQDTHWSPANSIYGDNPRKINERQDALGLTTYAYAPEITAIMQSGNLYVYCISNPLMYSDSTGNKADPKCWDYADHSVDIMLCLIVSVSLGVTLHLAAKKHIKKTSKTISGGASMTAAPMPDPDDDHNLSVDQIKKMLSEVEPNRIHHIMQEKHAWNLVSANDWSSIANIISLALANGVAAIGNAGNIIYTYSFQGQVIEVTTRIMDGVFKIVDALVRTR